MRNGRSERSRGRKLRARTHRASERQRTPGVSIGKLRALLAARGIDTRLLSDDEDLGAISGVVLCTLHRSKGLEAPRVILAGMQLVPARWPGEAEGDLEAWAHRERSLLYVGTTRARDGCGWSRVM